MALSKEKTKLIATAWLYLVGALVAVLVGGLLYACAQLDPVLLAFPAIIVIGFVTNWAIEVREHGTE